MKSGIDIADGSPESSVVCIKSIAKEVATELGGECCVTEERKDLSTHLDIDCYANNRHLRISLNYIEGHALPCAGNSFGGGNFFPVETEAFRFEGGMWQLDLECDEVNSKPVFRWKMTADKPHLANPDDIAQPPRFERPSHILDGLKLRDLLHERLSPRLPESP
jgi:hypothetical protein